MCYIPIMNKIGKREKKKQQHTIWFVIMYESLLVLFEFG